MCDWKSNDQAETVLKQAAMRPSVLRQGLILVRRPISASPCGTPCLVLTGSQAAGPGG